MCLLLGGSLLLSARVRVFVSWDMKHALSLILVSAALGAAARSFTSVTTTESAVWKPGAVVSLSNKAKGTVVETLADSL